MSKFNILIIDGDYLMHRMVNQGALNNLSYMVDGAEQPTGILKGVFGTMYNFIKDFNPDMVYFCLSGGRCTFRVNIYDGYKKKDPEKLKEKDEVQEGERFTRNQIYRSQTTILREMLPEFGIRVGSAPGFEADDVGMYLSWIYQRDPQNYKVTLISDDWDWAQSVEFGADVFRPVAEQLLTPQNFEEETGITKELFIFEKALLGDKSDGIPVACPGIGKVTARKLILGVAPRLDRVTIDSIVEAASDFVKGKRLLSLQENKEDWRRNMNLMAMNREVLKNLYPYLIPLMKNEVYFDYNKATIRAQKYGLNSLSNILVHPMMSKLK